MRKYCLGILLALLAFSISAQAQQVRCGFDESHNQQMQNSQYAAQVAAMKQAWQAHQISPSMMLATTQGTDTIYEVPVVVHIIHTGNAIGGLYNPTDADVQDMIDVMNQQFAATYPGHPTTTTGGVDMRLRFKLAQRGPNCVATTGINRINGTILTGYATSGVEHNGTSGAPEVDVKALSKWDNELYYNIWVVSAIDGYDGYSGGGVAGFAYLPPASSTYDGTMLVSKFVSDDYDDVTIITHEIGHAFGLLHTFDGDNGGSTCPPNTNCVTQGDEVCDTEPHIRSFSCPSGTNTCTGSNYAGVSENIMNYTNCVEKFTAGQEERAIFMGETYRSSLLHSSAGHAELTPPPAAVCTPSITNVNNNQNVGPRAVYLESIVHESGGYSTEGYNQYIDNTCYRGTFLDAAGTHNITVTTAGYQQNVVAYIDFNDDKNFTTNEIIMSSTTAAAGNYNHTASFTIPPGSASCTPLRMRVVSDRSTAAVPSACGTLSYGQAEDYTVYIEGSSDTISLAQTVGTNPSCPGSNVEFTANAVATINSYIWEVNGTQVSTGTSNVYSSSALADGDVLTVKATVASVCNPGDFDTISADVTILRQLNTNVEANLSFISGADTTCTGMLMELQADIINPTSPTYQWLLNGTPVGTGTDTLQFIPLNGDELFCIITDNNQCFNGSVSSDTIEFAVFNNLIASAQITQSAATPFPICDGDTVIFNASVNNEGSSPSYMWMVNGTSTGDTDLEHTTSTLNDGDVVSFQLVSNDACVDTPTVTSNTITAEVNPNLPVTSSITFTQGSNVICQGDVITVLAGITNGGTSPIFYWFQNGAFSGSTNPNQFQNLSDGDQIEVLAVSSETCTMGNPSTSTETITVNSTPSPIQISLNGQILEANPPAQSYQWYGPSGLIAGATSQTYSPVTSGSYYCIPFNPPCPGDASNVLDVYITSNKVLELADIKYYPNPATDELFLEWADDDIQEVYAYNAVGQKIEIGFAKSGMERYRMELPGTLQGLNVLEVRTENEVFYIKVLVNTRQ